MGRYAEAVRGFDRVIAAGPPQTRVYFMRARAHEQAGDHEGARRDRAEGLRLEPEDETSWVARRWPGPTTATSRAPWPTSAGPWPSTPGRPPPSRTRPSSSPNGSARRPRRSPSPTGSCRSTPVGPPRRGTRGVYLARLGRRDTALADAEALEEDRSPFIRHQAAGIYALTSRVNPDDRAERSACSPPPCGGPPTGRPGR